MAGADFGEGGSLACRWTCIFTSMGSYMWQSHGDTMFQIVLLMIETCRVRRPEDLIFAIKKMGVTSPERFLAKNVVFREVLLHRRVPPTAQAVPATNPATIPLPTDQSDDFDYTGIYDDIGEEEEEYEPRQERRVPPAVTAPPSLSAPLPSNVTLAALPTAREAEVFWVKILDRF